LLPDIREPVRKSLQTPMGAAGMGRGGRWLGGEARKKCGSVLDRGESLRRGCGVPA